MAFRISFSKNAPAKAGIEEEYLRQSKLERIAQACLSS